MPFSITIIPTKNMLTEDKYTEEFSSWFTDFKVNKKLNDYVVMTLYQSVKYS